MQHKARTAFNDSSQSPATGAIRLQSESTAQIYETNEDVALQEELRTTLNTRSAGTKIANQLEIQIEVNNTKETRGATTEFYPQLQSDEFVVQGDDNVNETRGEIGEQHGSIINGETMTNEHMEQNRWTVSMNPMINEGQVMLNNIKPDFDKEIGDGQKITTKGYVE